MRLRVMTYNLLYAFHERQGQTMQYHEERAHAAREVVRAEAPDILGLTEAIYCGFGGRILRPDYVSMFGLPHLYAAGFEGDFGNCLLSRVPLVQAARVSLGKTVLGNEPSAIRATLENGLHVDLVHPSPRVREAERVAAMAPILSSFTRPYVLMGDFNALSDEDPYDAATLVRELTGNVPDPQALAARMLDRQLIAEVRRHGLVETLAPADRTHTLPTTLDRPHATQGARLRLDYIFVSPEIRVHGAHVVKTPGTELVSDHYPVVADLELDA
jgi:endonuclease/exonuclease/phosphatase family metal-dependent hydrolase